MKHVTCWGSNSAWWVMAWYILMQSCFNCSWMCFHRSGGSVSRPKPCNGPATVFPWCETSTQKADFRRIVTDLQDKSCWQCQHIHALLVCVQWGTDPETTCAGHQPPCYAGQRVQSPCWCDLLYWVDHTNKVTVLAIYSSSWLIQFDSDKACFFWLDTVGLIFVLAWLRFPMQLAQVWTMQTTDAFQSSLRPCSMLTLPWTSSSYSFSTITALLTTAFSMDLVYWYHQLSPWGKLWGGNIGHLQRRTLWTASSSPSSCKKCSLWLPLYHRCTCSSSWCCRCTFGRHLTRIDQMWFRSVNWTSRRRKVTPDVSGEV